MQHLRNIGSPDTSVIDSFCHTLCKDTLDICGFYYEIMKQDVSPGGQYGRIFDTELGISGIDDEYPVDLSVYNDANLLPIRLKDSKYQNGHWQTLFNYETGFYADPGYTNKDGSPSYVKVNGEDESPENLDIETFYSNWQPSWSEGLVKFHPEYCLYEFCLAIDSSHAMDYDLLKTMNLHDAFVYGFIDSTNLLDTTYILNQDPFFRQGSPGHEYRAEMGRRLLHYDTLTVKAKVAPFVTREVSYTCSIFDLAAITAAPTYNHKDAFEYKFSVDQALNTWPFGVDDNEIRNQQWLNFKGFYYSLKQHFVSKAQKKWSIENGCFNECIGEYPDWDTTYYYSTNFAYNNANYNFAGDCAQPCSRLNYLSYFYDNDLQKRFRSMQYLEINGRKVSMNRDKSDEELTDSAVAAADAGMEKHCTDYCTAMSEQWIKMLRDCNIPSGKIDDVKQGLKEVCLAGCNEEYPFSRSVLPSGVTSSPNNYTSLEDLLIQNLGNDYESDLCNIWLLKGLQNTKIPLPKVRDTVEYLAVSEDCDCEKMYDDYHIIESEGGLSNDIYIDEIINLLNGIVDNHNFVDNGSDIIDGDYPSVNKNILFDQNNFNNYKKDKFEKTSYLIDRLQDANPGTSNENLLKITLNSSTGDSCSFYLERFKDIDIPMSVDSIFKFSYKYFDNKKYPYDYIEILAMEPSGNDTDTIHFKLSSTCGSLYEWSYDTISNIYSDIANLESQNEALKYIYCFSDNCKPV